LEKLEGINYFPNKLSLKEFYVVSKYFVENNKVIVAQDL
jgi:hypothetical protein